MTINDKLEGHKIWQEIDNYRSQTGSAAVLTLENLTNVICELHNQDPEHVRGHVGQWLVLNPEVYP